MRSSTSGRRASLQGLSRSKIFAVMSSRIGGSTVFTAANIQLTHADLREIDEGASRIRPEGDRYAPAQMAMVGREAPQKENA